MASNRLEAAGEVSVWKEDVKGHCWAQTFPCPCLFWRSEVVGKSDSNLQMKGEAVGDDAGAEVWYHDRRKESPGVSWRRSLFVGVSGG